MCFNVTPNNLSANQNMIRHGVLRDSNMSDPAPKTGMPMMCGASTVDTAPKNKGGELLEPLSLTTPQRFNAWSPPWRGVRLEGAKKSTLPHTNYMKLLFGTKFDKRKNPQSYGIGETTYLQWQNER